MDGLLVKLPEVLQSVSLVLTGLTLFATIIVRFTPSKSDDKRVAKFWGMLSKVLRWLPTIGVNPKTKEMEATIEGLQVKDEPAE